MAQAKAQKVTTAPTPAPAAVTQQMVQINPLRAYAPKVGHNANAWQVCQQVLANGPAPLATLQAALAKQLNHAKFASWQMRQGGLICPNALAAQKAAILAAKQAAK